jgi:hypothetical protein
MTTQIAAQVFGLDNTDTDGKLLKVAPPSEVIQAGFLKGTPVARIWFNYFINLLTTNTTFVETELLGIGTVLQYIQGTEPDFATDFIGTWASIGTQTVGARTVEYFERTA